MERIFDAGNRLYKSLVINDLRYGGQGGIRTPVGLRQSGFQDRRNQPLCHLSKLFTINYLRLIFNA